MVELVSNTINFLVCSLHVIPFPSISLKRFGIRHDLIVIHLEHFDSLLNVGQFFFLGG